MTTGEEIRLGVCFFLLPACIALAYAKFGETGSRDWRFGGIFFICIGMALLIFAWGLGWPIPSRSDPGVNPSAGLRNGMIGVVIGLLILGYNRYFRHDDDD